MLNLNKQTKRKSKPKPICKFKNRSHMWAYHCAHLSYTTQHRTIQFIFPQPPVNHHSSDAVYWRGGDHVLVGYHYADVSGCLGSFPSESGTEPGPKTHFVCFSP